MQGYSLSKLQLSQAVPQPAQPAQPADGLRALMQSPLYQVRRVLRVTQTHWVLPMARGKRAARLARREQFDAPLLTSPRPGSLALLAGG